MAIEKANRTEVLKKKKKQKYGMTVHLIFLSVSAIIALLLCGVIAFRYLELKNNNKQLTEQVAALTDELENSYSEEEVNAKVEEAAAKAGEEAEKETRSSILDSVKDHLLAGGSWLDAIKSLYPNELVVLDQGYCFIPISNTLKHHEYNKNQFLRDEDGFMQYQNDGKIISKRGIDVSVYQDKIDWKKVASDGVEYAFIRVGVRGYTKGDIIPDASFDENISGALKQKIDVGVYFVTQAINEEEAVAEAEFVLDEIEPYKVTYPIVIDVEDIENADPRSASLTMEERTKCIIAFCDTIKSAGYTPMIYGNMKSFLRRMDLEQLEDYKKWIAYYDDELYYPYDFDVWQYTDKGKINGVKDAVDCNISFFDAD